MSIIQTKDVKKWFVDFQALKGITMDVAEGEVLVVCGPSGSGKSTFIRCINRLEQHQEGQIIVDGIELTNDLKNIEAIRSEVGMVFQSFNLFPHLTVMQNITLAQIWVRKKNRAESEEKAMELFDQVINNFKRFIFYIEKSKIAFSHFGLMSNFEDYQYPILHNHEDLTYYDRRGNMFLENLQA